MASASAATPCFSERCPAWASSKRAHRSPFDSLAVGRVGDGQQGGVEQEPRGQTCFTVCWRLVVGIERVAEDRMAVGGGLDAQLVGTTGARLEADQGKRERAAGGALPLPWIVCSLSA